MKAFFSLHVLVICTVANELKTLEEVYGRLPDNQQFLAWDERLHASKQWKTNAYYSVRTVENCVFPLEVLILQDNTESFQDDRVQMRNVQLAEMFEALDSSHPNSSFALMAFKDKPFEPYGASTDYCQRLVVPLSPNQDAIFHGYDALKPIGGLDPPEAQFQALIAAAQSAKIGWSADAVSSKLIVLATDANPHFNLDGDNIRNLPPYSGTYEPALDNAFVEPQCKQQYYPSPTQVIEALERRKIYLAQLVFDGDWNNGIVRRSWQWFNNAYGQTTAFLQPLADDSSNFWQILSRVIKELESIECTPATTHSPSTNGAESAPTVPPLGSTALRETSSTASPETPTDKPPCECNPGVPCDCPEVVIKIMRRPKELHLDVKNE